jgi:membrane protein
MSNTFDRLLDRLDAFQRSRRPIAFAFAVIKKFGDDGGGRLAALVAYYAFLSLFPLLLVLVTVLGFVLDDNPELQKRVVDSALAQFPVVGKELGSNLDRLEGNLVALGVGLAGALWGGLGAMQAAQYAMNAVWDVPLRDRPGFFAKRLRSLIMLGVLGGGILASTIVTNLATYAPAQSLAG